MNCENMLELLPFRANGTLSEVERRQVDEHLASCPSCRRELQDTHLAASIYAAHPSPDELWRLAEGGAVSKAVDGHLASCATCAEELALVRESQAELARLEAQAEPAHAHAQAQGQGQVVKGNVVQGPWRKSPVLRFALAAGLAFAVLGPVLLMMNKSPADSAVVADNRLDLELVVRRGSGEAAASDLPTLSKSRGRATLSLTSSNFADRHEVMVHLYDGGEKQLLMVRGTLDTRLGVMQATFDASKLPEGTIEVEVFGASEDREPLGLTWFRVLP